MLLFNRRRLVLLENLHTYIMTIFMEQTFIYLTGYLQRLDILLCAMLEIIAENIKLTQDIT